MKCKKRLSNFIITLTIGLFNITSAGLIGVPDTIIAGQETVYAEETTGDGSISSSISPHEYIEQAKQNFTSDVPYEMKVGNKGKFTRITYFSEKAQRNKPANVWLPPDYSENHKYPVVYMNHGVMGSENDLISGWAICEMASNLIEQGKVKPFIIVFTQMYTDPNAERATGITKESMDRYDDFLYDLTESLMPYMSENYPIAEGRENTAIAGFSMGGRESLYIGMMAADKIGYICASSPAPGIVPAQDSYLDHRGSMTEDEFGFDKSYLPYLLMIGGGTYDGVVGTFPKQYHELYEKKGIDHIWFEVKGGGHDASVGTPLFYNFFCNLFKTSGFDNVKGDIDGNGSVTSYDFFKLMVDVVRNFHLTPLTSQQKINADIDGDGKITIADLAILKDMLI